MRKVLIATSLGYDAKPFPALLGPALCAMVLTGWLITTPVHAQFVGSENITSIGELVPAGVDLSNTNVFSLSSPSPFTGVGGGDFIPSPPLSLLLPSPLIIDLGNITALTLSSAAWGSFTSSGGFIVSRSADFVDVYLTGLFDNFSTDGSIPYTVFTAAGGDPASLRYSMTQSGAAVSWSGTLTVPTAAPPVPEPSTFVLAVAGLAGLAGLAMIRRRRRSA